MLLICLEIELGDKAHPLQPCTCNVLRIPAVLQSSKECNSVLLPTFFSLYQWVHDILNWLEWKCGKTLQVSCLKINIPCIVDVDVPITFSTNSWRFKIWKHLRGCNTYSKLGPRNIWGVRIFFSNPVKVFCTKMLTNEAFFFFFFVLNELRGLLYLQS